jgi:hypothetical protein
MNRPLTLVPLALSALAVAAAFIVHAPRAGAQTASTITVHDAWVRDPGASRTTTAVFLVVENAGSAPRAIVGGSSPVADTLELHEMKVEGGMMRMSPVKQIAVPAKGKVELRPGGLHLMLFGFKRPSGDTMQVTLSFDDGSSLSFPAQLRREAMR